GAAPHGGAAASGVLGHHDHVGVGGVGVLEPGGAVGAGAGVQAHAGAVLLDLDAVGGVADALGAEEARAARGAQVIREQREAAVGGAGVQRVGARGGGGGTDGRAGAGRVGVEGVAGAVAGEVQAVAAR